MHAPFPEKLHSAPPLRFTARVRRLPACENRLRSTKRHCDEYDLDPQTAAKQDNKNYSDVTTPEPLRIMAEKAVDQGREVYDRSKDALDASVATFERTFDVAGQGAVAFNRKIIDIAQRNVNSGFDLAKSLAGAQNLSEMVELQSAYWQKLLNTLTSQAEKFARSRPR